MVDQIVFVFIYVGRKRSFQRPENGGSGVSGRRHKELRCALALTGFIEKLMFGSLTHDEIIAEAKGSPVDHGEQTHLKKSMNGNFCKSTMRIVR